MKSIRKSGYRASYSVHKPKRIRGLALPLPNYKQQDYYCCGFLATLTVSDYYQTRASPQDLLMAVQPGVNTGTSRSRVVRGLASVGVKATYYDDLTTLSLLCYVMLKIPVIVSVWPDDWIGDHWTVVQGFNEKLDRIYLTNHYNPTISQFNKEWIVNWGDGSTTGAGLVCERM